MISAKVICDSIFDGKRITSLQLKMPRFILAQFNTHRAFSRSTASSRAIPTAKLIDMVRTNFVQPIHWGKNQAGMQASEELPEAVKQEALREWHTAALNAANTAEKLLELGCHKQVANRILEPFMWVDTIVTATEWDNFFKLRLDDASQPEIQELARCMKEALDNSMPVERIYHLPYISEKELEQYKVQATDKISWKAYDELVQISAARCARVSYSNHDQSNPDVEKDKATADKLLSGGHWSPFEHQAHAITWNDEPCRNFIGWEQARAIFEPSSNKENAKENE